MGELDSAEVGLRLLAAVVVVLVAARGLGWLLQRMRQPRVMGEILAGIALGPSLLGQVWPEATEELFPPQVVASLRALALLGLVLFMFLVGLELDLGALRGQGHRAVAISHSSIVLPMVLGFGLGLFLEPRVGVGADRFGFALFVGAAMSITAFPVLARILRDGRMTHTRLGVLVITCAAVDDITAWCVLAVVVAIVEADGMGSAVQTVALSLAYVGVALLVVRPALRRLGTVPLWLAVVVAVASAWTTEWIGIHAIFGAFMAGAVMPRDHRFRAALDAQVRPLTDHLLLPMFFAVVGLATRIDLLDDLYLWGLTALVVLVAVAGKFGGASLAARATGESWRDASIVGVLMNTRGLTEIVILTVGLELGVIGDEMFTIMVVMALVTTLMAAPILSLLRPEREPEGAADADDEVEGLRPDEVAPPAGA